MRIAMCSGRRRSFPIAPKRKYTPCDAPKEKLFALRDFLGFDKNVIVQATCHNTDNRALVDALETSNGKAKGVAFVGEEVTDDELKAHGPRRRARACASTSSSGWSNSTPQDVMQRIASAHRQARLAHRGLFRACRPDEMGPFLKSLPTTLVFDHMACPNVKKGVDTARHSRTGSRRWSRTRIWITKVTCPERFTRRRPAL